MYNFKKGFLSRRKKKKKRNKKSIILKNWATDAEGVIKIKLSREHTNFDPVFKGQEVKEKEII